MLNLTESQESNYNHVNKMTEFQLKCRFHNALHNAQKRISFSRFRPQSCY